MLCKMAHGMVFLAATAGYICHSVTRQPAQHVCTRQPAQHVCTRQPAQHACQKNEFSVILSCGVWNYQGALGEALGYFRGRGMAKGEGGVAKGVWPRGCGSKGGGSKISKK